MLNLTERAMLVSLNIRQWSSSKLDARVSADVAAMHGSDINMGRYTKDLLSKSAVKELTRIKGAARTLHYELTLPWLDNGMRILSAMGYPVYESRINKLSDEWDIATREFVANYPALVADARVRLNGLFRDSDYPSVHQIKSKFSFGFNVSNLPSADDFRVKLGTAELSTIKHRMQSDIDATVQLAMADVWDRYKIMIGHMADKLRAYSVSADGTSSAFRDSLVDNLRDLIALIPSLNITNDPNIARFADRIEVELLSYTAQELRDSAYKREEISTNAEDILRAMGDYI